MLNRETHYGRTLAALIGSTIFVLCATLLFAYANIRNRVQATDELSKGLSVMDHLDLISGDLDLMKDSQVAFLLTHNILFNDTVASATIDLINNITWLTYSVRHEKGLTAPVAKLTAAVTVALRSIKQSYDVQGSSGVCAAVAFLTSDTVVDSAKQDAKELKRVVLNNTFEPRCKMHRNWQVVFGALL
jgi:hypothetical protein